MNQKKAKQVRKDYEKESGFEEKDRNTTSYKMGYKKFKKSVIFNKKHK